VYQYSLSSAWSLSSASYDSVSFSTVSFVYALYFKGDGTQLYLMYGFLPDSVIQYRLSSAWDLSTTQTKGNYYFTPNVTVGSSYTFAFKEDGTKLYIALEGTIYQYSLATAWSIPTATYDSVSFSTSSQIANLRSIFFKPDGTKMYALDESIDTAFQYSLSSPWDLSTASYDSVSYAFTSPIQVAAAFRFKSDGTKLYLLDSFNDAIYQYSLSSAWSLSSVTYDSVSFSTASQGSVPTSFFFKSDGTRMFIGIDGTVYQYALSSAWDLSSASYSSVSKSLASQNITTINNLWFRSNGTRMFTLQRLPGNFMLQYEVA
jgi:predicted heme/steroid binding protein